jgi:CheY-like chemotaxis protein
MRPRSRDSTSFDKKGIVCIGAAISRLEALAASGVALAPSVDIALNVASAEAELVVIDMREGRPLEFRRLRHKFSRAFLLALVDTRTPLQTKWEATKAGCDDFIVLSPGIPEEDLAAKLAAVFSASQLKRQRILVVDDEENNRELLRQELGEANFDVVLTADGPAALAIAAAESIDLVLLDIMMPDMDGRDVCARLRADARTKNVPIVMLSALDQVRDKLQALDMGANDYVTKPYDADQLIAKIRRLLWLRGAQGQLERNMRR